MMEKKDTGFWMLDEQIPQMTDNRSITKNIVTQGHGEFLTYL